MLREMLKAAFNFAVAVILAAAAILYANEIGAWRTALWVGVAIFLVTGFGLIIHSIVFRRRIPATKTPVIRTVAELPPFNPTRDVEAGEAIAYLGFGEWGKRFIDAASSTTISGAAEYDQFLQGAADGTIPVWGKKAKHMVYEPILKEYWYKNRIDWFSLLRGDANSESSVYTFSGDRYLSLMTSRAAVEKIK